MDDIAELRARIDDLSVEIRRLRDLEEIRRVKLDYAAAVDRFAGDTPDADAFGSLFAPDGRWDVIPGKSFAGPEQIGAVIAASGGKAATSLHIVSGGRIDVDGDRATGTWYKLLPMPQENGEMLWSIGKYADEFVRTEDGWRIARATHRALTV